MTTPPSNFPEQKPIGAVSPLSRAALIGAARLIF